MKDIFDDLPLLIDSHCHLTSARFDEDRDALIEAFPADGLAGAIGIGTGLADAAALWSLCQRHRGRLLPAAGLDPFTAHAAGDAFTDELARLTDFHRTHRCVAVGEIGLDYHYELGSTTEQRARLEPQLALAVELDLPVVIHVREAHDDLMAILREHPARGVIHSFTAGPTEADSYLALGWHLSFNGVATFKNAPEVREAVRLTPSERLLVETDSPYLAPEPLRGRRCQPAHLRHTVIRLAAERSERPADLATSTTQNACRLFGLSINAEAGLASTTPAG